MLVPKFKRIKVSSQLELKAWLAKSDREQDVMIVTCNNKSSDKYVSSAQVRDGLRESGWLAGKSYTLPGSLNGHIASKA